MSGLTGCGGSTNASEELALTLGYLSVGDLIVRSSKLGERVKLGDALTGPEWMTAIATAEFFFGSGVRGGADDAEFTEGIRPGDAVEAIGQARRVWYSVARLEAPWWHRSGLGTRPLRDAGAKVFTPAGDAEVVSDRAGRARLGATLDELARGPSRGAMSEVDNFFRDRTKALEAQAIFDDPRAIVGTVVVPVEAGALARLRELLRPWATSPDPPLSEDELTRREVVWPLACGVAAELHACIVARPGS